MLENSRFVKTCERLVFTYRSWYVISFFLLTIFFGYHAMNLKMDSSLEKMVPMHHEYIQNWFKHKDDLSLGNDLRIAVDGGFLSVTEEGVTILAESAEFESEIDESSAREDSESDDPKIAARGRARLRAVGAID